MRIESATIRGGNFGKPFEVDVGMKPSRILTGGQDVIIDKMYGPACCVDVKVSLDLSKGEWVFSVDRQANGVWVEVARTLVHVVDMSGFDEGDE